MKIATGKVRLSYANIWTPKSFNGQAPKYTANLIIPKSDEKTIGKIKATFEALKKDPVSINKWGGKVTNLNIPLRDGDEERSQDAAYANSYFMNVSTAEAYPPRIVDRNKQEILDHAEVYSGCYVQAVINFSAYNNAGNKGIGAYLQGIRKLADGEPLTSSIATDDDFSDVDDVDDLF